MSADNWMQCPRCLLAEGQRLAEREKVVKDSYGNVPREEYQRRVAELAGGAPELPETFREDYEMGVTDSGEFYVSYRGTCTECGLLHEFKHTEQLAIEPPAE